MDGLRRLAGLRLDGTVLDVDGRLRGREEVVSGKDGGVDEYGLNGGGGGDDMVDVVDVVKAVSDGACGGGCYPELCPQSQK